MTNQGVAGFPGKGAAGVAEIPIIPPASLTTTAVGSVAWYSANRTTNMRFTVGSRTKLAGGTMECGTASGNIELAIYSATRVAASTFYLTKIGGSGVIACPTPSSSSIWVPFQTPVTLDPGQYAVGLWCDNTTATFAHVIANGILRSGYALSDGGFSPTGGALNAVPLSLYAGRAFGVTLEAAIPS